MNQSLSVVIPNYNGKKLLEKNIPFLLNAIETSNITSYEVIISDDNSKDDSVSFIKKKYPDFKLIENNSNRGFSGNTNIGLKAASKELILILNSDIQLSNSYFIPLLPYFNIPDTFGVMGRIIGIDSDEIQVAAKFPVYNFGNIIPGKSYTSTSSTSLYSLFLSGANALVSRTKLVEIGCFNENFNPYYYEDVELGLRAWRMGYKLYYEHNAICRHQTSATITKEPVKRVKIIAKRNKMMLHYIHFNGFELWYYMIKLVLKTVLRTLILDAKYVKSFYFFICSVSQLNKSKATFKALQKGKNIDLTINDIIKVIKDSMRRLKIIQI